MSSFSEIQAKYDRRGFSVAPAGPGQFLISRTGKPLEGLLRVFSREALEDVGHVIQTFEEEYSGRKSAEETHKGFSGKELYEMTFDEWWEWNKIHKDAGRLLERAKKELFPGKSTGDLRRIGAHHPNGVLGFVHEKAVENALSKRLPIPQKVLEEYSHLLGKFKDDEPLLF